VASQIKSPKGDALIKITGQCCIKQNHSKVASQIKSPKVVMLNKFTRGCCIEQNCPKATSHKKPLEGASHVKSLDGDEPNKVTPSPPLNRVNIFSRSKAAFLTFHTMAKEEQAMDEAQQCKQIKYHINHYRCL
jgi:hypothetical protein